jgi:hypothetical protein
MMDEKEQSPPIGDLAARERRNRRRILLGTAAAGSVIMTLPARRALATGGVGHSNWPSFSKNPQMSSHFSSGGPPSCGDHPDSWKKYCKSSNPDDYPSAWLSWCNKPFESVCPRPAGYDCYVDGTKQSTSPTFNDCLYRNVEYRQRNSNTLIHPLQTVTSLLNAQYYTLGTGTCYYRGGDLNKVLSSFGCSPSPALSPPKHNAVSSTFASYNTD